MKSIGECVARNCENYNAVHIDSFSDSDFRETTLAADGHTCIGVQTHCKLSGLQQYRLHCIKSSFFFISGVLSPIATFVSEGARTAGLHYTAACSAVEFRTLG